MESRYIEGSPLQPGRTRLCNVHRIMFCVADIPKMIDPLLYNETIKTRLLENILEIINSNDEKFLDISIVCRDGSFLWSQFLLAAASDLFAKAMQGIEVTQVIFPDLQVEDVRGNLLGLLDSSASIDSLHRNDDFLSTLGSFSEINDSRVCADFVKIEMDEAKGEKDVDLNWMNAVEPLTYVNEFESDFLSKTKQESCTYMFGKYQNLVKKGLGQTYSCENCNYQTKWKGDLKKHIDSIHDNVTHSCDYCDYKATQKGALQRHMQKVHGVV